MAYSYTPSPNLEKRKERKPVKTRHMHRRTSAFDKFNAFLAVKITDGVGTMWCAYAFMALALVSLPEAIQGGIGPLISWIAQTFLQLVLLSIIMVGQRVASAAADKRSEDMYEDTETILHEVHEIHGHLDHQDERLSIQDEQIANILDLVTASIHRRSHSQKSKVLGDRNS